MSDPTTQPSSRASRLIPDMAACIVLLLLLALFFWRLWTPDLANRLAFPIGDFTDQYYPLRYWVSGMLAEGQVPVWNPFIWGGQPGLADPQAATFYPATWLQALLWKADLPLAALQAEVVAHVGLAALGSYAFARRALRLSPLPALTSAITFGFGGYLTGFPLEQLTILETVAWLPWLLLASHHAVDATTRAARLRSTALAALLLAVALLAGHPQSALYLVYLAFAYVLFHLFSHHESTPWVAGLRKRWPVLLLFPLAIGMAALQLLPTRAFIADSSRQALDYAFVQGGLEWRGLIEILIPKLVGSNPQYVGLVPLLLVPLAFFHRERREWFFWLGVAVASLMLSLGGLSALFDLLYIALPALAEVRNQERVLVLWSWSLALLAGGGMAWLQQSVSSASSRRRLRGYLRGLHWLVPMVLFIWLLLWVIYIAGTSNFAREQFNFYYDVFYLFLGQYSRLVLTLFVALGLLFFWSRRPRPQAQRWLSGLLLALLIWELFTANRPYHFGPPPAEALSPQTAVVTTLQAQQGETPGRVAVIGETNPRSNDGMRWRLPLLSGNEPLQLALTADFLATTATWPQLQAFGAPYLVADFPLDADAPDAYQGLTSAEGAAPTWLAQTRVPMPYAWLVGRSTTLPDDKSALDQLRGEPPDLHQQALLTQPLSLDGPPLPPGEGVQVLQRGPQAEIRVTNPHDGPMLLLIAEPAVAGWQSTLDGEPIEWQRANSYNIALLVPPGEHTITLRYEPPGWRAGLWLSGLSLLATLLLLGLGGRQAD